MIGGTIGEGTLTFRGRTLSALDRRPELRPDLRRRATNLHGPVSNINSPRDVEGVYGAGSAGAAVIRGPQAVVLTNQRGAVMELSGTPDRPDGQSRSQRHGAVAEIDATRTRNVVAEAKARSASSR